MSTILTNGAAIAIYDGGIPEAYAEAFAQLQIAQPIGVHHPEWLRAIDDAGRFLDQWGNVAAQLQWSAEDIFKKPAALTVKTPPLDLGTFGLCWVVHGRNVVALDACSATSGDRRRSRRRVASSPIACSADVAPCCSARSPWRPAIF